MSEETKTEVKPEEEKESVAKRLVPPHDKISRLVTKNDLPRVIADAQILYKLCFTPLGLYRGAYAMAHPQIDDKDPLQMFVTEDRKIVLNPVITKHSGYTVDS